MRDDLAEGPHVGTVLPDGVRLLCEFSDAGPLQQHRIGEPLDAGCGHTRNRRDLLYGRPGPDPGLDLAWPHRVFLLDLELAEPSDVTTSGRTQPLVRGQEEPFTPLRVFAHDGRAVLV